MVIFYYGLSVMTTQQQRRAQTRRKIINAARKLSENQGFDQISVNQIVAEANVAKGTFYQYYETKIDVLLDLTRDNGTEKTRAALESVRQGAPALPILQSYVKQISRWFEEHKNFAEAIILSTLKTVGLEETMDTSHYSRTFLLELMKMAQDQGALRSDIDTKELAKIIGSTLVVSVLAWSKNPVNGALVDSMQTSLTLFLEGALPQESKS